MESSSSLLYSSVDLSLPPDLVLHHEAVKPENSTRRSSWMRNNSSSPDVPSKMCRYVLMPKNHAYVLSYRDDRLFYCPLVAVCLPFRQMTLFST